MKRNLDGVFFRINREDGKWDNVCFSDLTPEEQDEMMKGRSEEWLKSMCKTLAKTISMLGEQFDIISKYGDEEGDDE